MSTVFLITANRSSIDVSQMEDLRNYHKNYIHEANIVINNAIMYDKNITKELMDYTNSYIDYAKTKEMDLGIVFLYSKDDKIHIVNFLNEPVLVSTVGLEVNSGQSLTIDLVDTVTLNYQGNNYNYFFSSDILFKTLFVENE